ncbi:MAG: peroxiredoxin [Candidatus Mesenet longicola]|uniref:thioredoxin-dependent peroxiredoxin n=1 Tax=Candidatus Mesenet longicola TaxID=1892558 RepID=A0A8J3HX77_9RICK|nr:MAG: peroxiredoxin [Candidatus Mesenet longicola]GHM59936.1 MAG: peroxiredoxin [Candidatus Mesenet longicola]
MILKIGDKAPEFELHADNGKIISLSEFYDQKNIVLYFYPKDNTPGCTVEAKDFRDNIEEFSRLNTVVIGASKDSIRSHINFKIKYSLPFCLISDESTEVLQKYGVWVEKSMFGKKYMGIERATFLIDKSGIIKQIWRNVKVNGHVLKVLKEIKNE